ncbi:MAG TPA: universal stress protein [Ktedonobacteraceae bacterium]|nr:universal stress protein [Ktedonobacteraceae bacterium]
MKQKRLLLPFTHGVEMRAIEEAVQLARKEHATLLPLSLLPSHERSNRLRFEHIQQSKDFLEAVKQKAARQHVPVEPVELQTDHPTRTINEFAHKHKVSGVVLLTRDGRGVLLSTNQVQHLLEKQTSLFYIIQLPTTISKRILMNVLKSPARLARRLSGTTAAEPSVEPPPDMAQV